MSTIRNPVGPRSPQVYRRRRLTVLVALIAVIAIIAFLVLRLVVGNAADGDSAVPAASDAPVAAAPSPTPELVEGADCLPANVTVDAVTDKESYAAGELPQLSFSLTNTSGVSCTFNAGTTQQNFEISSGEEVYWSSKDCETDPVDAPILLEPNLAQSPAPISWNRTRSSTTTCEGERPAVPAGGATYNLSVTVGASTSEVAKSFLLY